MKIKRYSIAIFVILSLSIVGIYFYIQIDEPSLAARRAEKLLSRYGLDISEFSGPEVLDSKFSWRQYRWHSREMHPPMIVDISPSGNMECISKVEDDGQKKIIECFDD